MKTPEETCSCFCMYDCPLHEDKTSMTLKPRLFSAADQSEWETEQAKIKAEAKAKKKFENKIRADERRLCALMVNDGTIAGEYYCKILLDLV